MNVYRVLCALFVSGLMLPAIGSAKPITVASYNVNFGLSGDPVTLKAIGETKADLIFLQETTPGWERAINRELSQTYPHRSFHHCCRAGGLAVLSKFPIVREKVLDAPTGWFPAWVGVIQTPLGPVQALNVHLRPPISDSGSWVAGYFTTGKYRHQELKAYVGALEPGLPTIAVGDFNEQRGDALDLLESRGMRDAVQEDAPNTATWRWRIGDTTLEQVLDHVFYSRHLEAKQTTVLKRGRSDHLPVRVVLDRARKP